MLMIMVMITACIYAAQAAGAPEIISHPAPQIVEAGESCVFTASAKGHTGITWRLQSPDGREDFPFTDAPNHFKGLKISGKNSNKLTLKNIPGEMDGWMVYCRYSNKAGRADTYMAPLFVTDRSGNRLNAYGAPAETPAPAYQGEKIPAANGEKILRAIGCSIQFIDDAGNAKGDSFTELNFGEAYYNTLTKKTVTDQSVDVRIAAEIPKGEKAAYWVINGTKYTFNTEVKSFTLRELDYSMTVEAVLSSASVAQTQPTLQEIQQYRTGAGLLAESRDARMAHVNEAHKASGGYFSRFDFTNDFTNQATGKTEQGGRVTLRVSASIPEGKHVSFWRFNGARLNFNSDVTSFIAENLAESMLYQPYFYSKATPEPTATPVPSYTVRCEGCTFYGGGYSGATSGTVPYGTKITLMPYTYSPIGYWTGTFNKGSHTSPVNCEPVTYTVKSNCNFSWHGIVN